VINTASIKRDLSDIERRLRLVQAQIDRAHEGLALKFHREEVVKETACGDAAGELDAQCEAGTKEGVQPRA
jgi:hypothetical protein